MALKKTTLIGIIELAIAAFMFIVIWNGIGAFVAYVLPAILITATLIGAFFYTKGESFDSKIPGICAIIVGIAFFVRTIINAFAPMELFGYWGAMIVLPVAGFYLYRNHGNEKVEDDKKANKEPEKIRLKKDLDDTLAAIDQDEITHFLRLAQDIEDAKETLTTFATTMATHESQWQEQLRLALLPFDNEIVAATSEVEDKQKLLDAAELELKDLNTQKFQKNADSAIIAQYYQQLGDAGKAKNAASTELGTAKRTLAAKQADRVREEQNQQSAISILRNADQVELQNLQAALRAAERAKNLAELTDKADFNSRRREANSDYDEAIARLE